MKIEIKERGSKEYYDEFLYVSINKNKIGKNPNKKATKLSNSAISYCFITVVFLIAFLILHFVMKEKMYLYVSIFFGVILVISILYLFLIFKRINLYRNSTGVNTFEINEEYVEAKNESISYKLKWDEIKYIVINKYTICVIPNEINKSILSVNKKFKDEVLTEIKKYGKEELIIDNSNLY